MDYDYTKEAHGVPVFLEGLPSLQGQPVLEASQVHGLKVCIARAMAFKPARLGTREIVHLREFMDLTIIGISKVVNLDDERIEYMEQGHFPVSGTYEFALRHLVMDDLGETPPQTRTMFAWSKEYGMDRATYRIDASDPGNFRLLDINPAQ